MGLFADRATVPTPPLVMYHGSPEAAEQETRRYLKSDAGALRVATLLIAGKTYTEIAAEMAIDIKEIRAIALIPRVREVVKATFAERRSAMVRALDGATLEALRYLRETLADPMATTKERIKCATELLDRGGLPRGVKLDIHNRDTGTTIEIENVNALSDAEIEDAARLALERRGRLIIPLTVP